MLRTFVSMKLHTCANICVNIFLHPTNLIQEALQSHRRVWYYFSRVARNDDNLEDLYIFEYTSVKDRQEQKEALHG